ncbi:MAG: 4-(cytidine 5'-diphospho)-2-C-methyl-D-erythritol kinase [Burkholderiales bacterium]|jgi:4-diphosphocytidyl-2-C-methyl-D-erythritol kinase|nr:4-(cytidine 5'-diphospho)-2-C-methyl-D-erythritol kinase [Burkholderiales bacterium]
MTSFLFPAPAKINLFLHVVGQRADGYHLIESVFAPVAFGDFVSLTPTDNGVISRVRAVDNIPEETDLTLRAARLLQKAASVKSGVIVSLTKNIPIGSGLGGGSSDAATVLLALNRLWGIGYSRAQLSELALELGADVPFFIGGTPAFVSGIGEQLTPVSLPARWIAMVFPQVIVPTSTIFASKDLTRDSAKEKIAAFAMGHGKNDLEPVAESRHSVIKDARLYLKQHAQNARMSGSGSAVFAVFDDPNVARDALVDLESPFLGVVTRILNRHPLIKWELR